MIGGLLLALRWLLVALGCVLGLLLVLLLLILLVPLRYRVEADLREPGPRGEGMADRASARVEVTWLLRLVRGSLCYPAEDGALLRLRVACFTLFPRREEPAEEKGTEETEPPEEGAAAEEAPEGGEDKGAEGSLPASEEGLEGMEAKGPEEPSPAPAEEGEKASSAAGPERPGEEARSSVPLGERLRRLGRFLDDLHKNTRRTLEKFYYTFRKTCAKIRKVRVMMESATFSRAKRVLFNAARRIWRHILPRRGRAEVTYGSGDPASTGQMLARVCMLYPILEDRLMFTPVFDREIVYGSARLRGRIVPAVPVWCALRCLLDRDIRAVWRRARKLGDVGGG